MSNSQKNGRRAFIKSTAAGAAGLSLLSPARLLSQETALELSKGPGNKWPGRVVINFNRMALENLQADEAVIKRMVDDAIQLLTGESSVGEAWKAIFPDSLSVESKIAIKICILNNALPVAHPFSVMGITEGLRQMDFQGNPFPAQNITIYDMNNNNSMESAGYTAERFPGITLVKDSSQQFGNGASSNRAYARTLNECDFLINVFSPRGQSEDVGYVTLGFKSHYGTYANPRELHGSPAQAYLRDFTCTGPVFEKTVLSFCSGMYGMNEGNGPRGDAEDYSNYAQTIDPQSDTGCPTTIILSTDPVSAEMQAIKMMRLNRSGMYSVESMPAYLKASAGIGGSLDPAYNIGIINEEEMDIRRIINGEIIATPVRQTASVGAAGDCITVQKTGASSVFIQYSFRDLPPGSAVRITVYDARGRIVRNLSGRIRGFLNHATWDGTDMSGGPVTKGMYVIRIVAAKKQLVARIVVK
jgi:hypothetical protein